MFRGFLRALLIGASVWGSAALAATSVSAAPKTNAKVDVEALRAELESGEEGRMLSALAELSTHGKDLPEAANLLRGVLERGASVPVIEAALSVASLLARAELSEAVARYTRHRSPSVRLTATRTLGATGGTAAIPALRAALRSADAAVRGAAAEGLGRLGAKEAVGELFLALDRRVLQAASAIGRLCAPPECLALSERLGRVPLEAMTDGIDHILLRSASEMPDEHKVKVIARVAALATADAARYLVGVANRWPAGDAGKARRALKDAIESLGEKDPLKKP
ncbi:MAG TPA: HEAT repeat domain-containing protein [Polyangiaceae bacterium]|jgi:hypothetical protein